LRCYLKAFFYLLIPIQNIVLTWKTINVKLLSYILHSIESLIKRNLKFKEARFLLTEKWWRQTFLKMSLKVSAALLYSTARPCAGFFNRIKSLKDILNDVKTTDFYNLNIGRSCKMIIFWTLLEWARFWGTWVTS
jgi:hypothetical protein